MAKAPFTTTHKARAVRLACWIGLCVAPIAVLGQALIDPMRPPAAPASQTTPSAAPLPKANAVQVLLIGENRKYAVVDGVIVRQGDTLNGWRVTRISSTGVMLSGAGSSETLSITPRVIKTPRDPSNQNRR